MYRGLVECAGAKGNRLVGQRQGIPHGPARGARQQTQRLQVGAHALVPQHMHQVFADGLGRHRPQVELQATRQHRHRNFLRVGGGQHELEVFRRLFQRLQHRVEGWPGQHMHFVDHEDLEAPLHRLVDRLLQQGLHVVDAAVGGCVEFGVVDEAARIDVGTGLAHATRRGGDATRAIRAQAIERLGEDARHRCLAHAACTGEEVRVVQPLRVQRIGQGAHHMLLPDHLREVLRTVLAGEHEVGHATILVGG